MQSKEGAWTGVVTQTQCAVRSTKLGDGRLESGAGRWEPVPWQAGGIGEERTDHRLFAAGTGVLWALSYFFWRRLQATPASARSMELRSVNERANAAADSSA